MGTRSSPLLEKREDELMWMQRRKGAEWHMSKRLEKHSKRGESSAAQKGKSAAEQRTTRRVRMHSKRGGQLKGGQENLQDVERSVIEYWGREDRYA